MISIEQSGEAVESLLLIGCSRKIAPLHVNTLAPLCDSCVTVPPAEPFLDLEVSWYKKWLLTGYTAVKDSKTGLK